MGFKQYLNDTYIIGKNITEISLNNLCVILELDETKQDTINIGTKTITIDKKFKNKLKKIFQNIDDSLKNNVLENKEEE